MEYSGWLKGNKNNNNNNNKMEGAPSCPRCASCNTKFCYFNNYSFSQPRYFCKSCRRYWTKGGSLRNVPVGGASRKSRPPNKPSRHSAISLISCPRRHHDTPNSDESGGSPHIDMALLFSNFVNHNTTTTTTMNTAGSSPDQSVGALKEEETHPPPSDYCDDDMTDGICQGGHHQSLSGHDYELDDLFGGDDEVMHDVLWSDFTTSFTWQPPPTPIMPFPFPHDLDYSSQDDLFPIPSL